MEDIVGNGVTLWFTGLSGSGKSTVSLMVATALRNAGYKVEILDGDVVRTNLSKGLGFSKEDRDINIKRIGFVCKLLTRNDVIAISAAISPYREIRDFVREDIGDFVEIYCDSELDVLIERDTKGLYKKALAGEIENFTGISDPYEPPENPELVLKTDSESPGDSAQKVIEFLIERGVIDPARLVPSYEEEDEEKIKKRLEDLGYL
ncbi:MAG: adenylyl-sulfate kinase [Deltaproteobacteria bacterium]|nr:adenylyl-sulfate kinase [Candidatus Zymogenaceae bacterium]